MMVNFRLLWESGLLGKENVNSCWLLSFVGWYAILYVRVANNHVILTRQTALYQKNKK